MKPILALAAVLLLFPALLRGGESTVVAKAGGVELTTQDVREALAGLEAGKQDTLTRDPAAIGQYVRALLIQRLVLKQAEEKQFDKDPAVIARLVRARETALAEAWLESFSRPPAGYPSADELAAAYESAKASLLLPASYHLAQIFVKEEAALPEIRKKLAVKGADFAAIAKAHSQETASAAKGGEIGWLTADQIQPAIRDAIAGLKPGGVSAPVKLDGGWHILKLIAAQEPTTATLAQATPALTARLRADKAAELRRQYLDGLLKDHPAAINPAALTELSTAP